MVRDIDRDGENLDGSRPSDNSPGEPSSADVKPDPSGDQPRAVPYHRFQKEVGKRHELESQIEDMQSQLQRLQETRQVVKETPTDNAPDPDEDPVAHANWRADRAERGVSEVRKSLEQVQDENKQRNTLNDLWREFEITINKYPKLDREDYREFAWEQFCIGKDKSRGRASGDEILGAVESLFTGFTGEQQTTKPATQHLRGKPKAATRTELDIPAGEQPKLDGKLSFRTKLDRQMTAATRNVISRLRASDRKTSGM